VTRKLWSLSGANWSLNSTKDLTMHKRDREVHPLGQEELSHLIQNN
jgi:hypothetical protein